MLHLRVRSQSNIHQTKRQKASTDVKYFENTVKCAEIRRTLFLENHNKGYWSYRLRNTRKEIQAVEQVSIRREN